MGADSERVMETQVGGSRRARWMRKKLDGCGVGRWQVGLTGHDATVGDWQAGDPIGAGRGRTMRRCCPGGIVVS